MTDALNTWNSQKLLLQHYKCYGYLSGLASGCIPGPVSELSMGTKVNSGEKEKVVK